MKWFVFGGHEKLEVGCYKQTVSHPLLVHGGGPFRVACRGCMFILKAHFAMAAGVYREEGNPALCYAFFGAELDHHCVAAFFGKW